jgi:hypothetical protein
VMPWKWCSDVCRSGSGERAATGSSVSSRHDVSDSDLFMQSFDPKDPVTGKPRLRFPGDRTSPTWRARQEGAKYLAAGASMAIRNDAAHEDTVDWSEQEALEHLAVLSVVARWVDECEVESAG